jgi:hypothetical protein
VVAGGWPLAAGQTRERAASGARIEFEWTQNQELSHTMTYQWYMVHSPLFPSALCPLSLSVLSLSIPLPPFDAFELVACGVSRPVMLC